MIKSCRPLHTVFHSSEQRLVPTRNRELTDRAMDVPIINTNLEGGRERAEVEQWDKKKSDGKREDEMRRKRVRKRDKMALYFSFLDSNPS